jgi:hypothetical protein
MQRKPINKQARSLTFVLCLGMLAGVLIWAKLRLVTDIPRSAYADPEEVSADQIDDQSDHDLTKHEEATKAEP